MRDTASSQSSVKTWKARWAFVRPYLARYKVPIAAGWSFVLLSTALDQAGPWMVKLIIEHLESGRPALGLAWPLGGLVVATAVSAFMLYYQRLWLIQASRKMEYRLRKDLFAGLMAQPKAFFDAHTIGDLMSRATNDLDRIRDLVGPVVLHLARMGCLVIYSAICLALLDPRLLLTGLLPALAMPLIANVFLQRMYALFGRIQKSLSSLNGFVQDSLTGIQVVKAFGREETFARKFEAESEELRDASLKVATFNAAIWPAIAVMGAVGLVLTTYFGGRMVVRDEISLGTLSAAILYLLRLQWPLIGLGWVASMVQRANASLDRVIALRGSFLVDPDSVPTSPSGAGLLPPLESLEARNLSFAYAGGPTVLQRISLKLEPGKSLGIVGPTGAGKTTLVHLLSGLYDSPPGTLFLNGVPREESNAEAWQAHFSYAPQDGFLFSETIRANIAMGAPSGEANGIEAVVEEAGLARDLTQFPDGYDTLLGEKGINLSGGQRQRVGLARALLSPAPILCLDDTLSALDAETEAVVLEGLRKKFREKCLVLVAHRYSAVLHCDKIIFLEDGRVKEEGTHEELLRLGGSYAEVWERQKLSVSLEES